MGLKVQPPVVEVTTDIRLVSAQQTNKQMKMDANEYTSINNINVTTIILNIWIELLVWNENDNIIHISVWVIRIRQFFVKFGTEFADSLDFDLIWTNFFSFQIQIILAQKFFNVDSPLWRILQNFSSIGRHTCRSIDFAATSTCVHYWINRWANILQT